MLSLTMERHCSPVSVIRQWNIVAKRIFTHYKTYGEGNFASHGNHFSKVSWVLWDFWHFPTEVKERKTDYYPLLLTSVVKNPCIGTTGLHSQQVFTPSGNAKAKVETVEGRHCLVFREGLGLRNTPRIWPGLAQPQSCANTRVHIISAAMPYC